MSDGQGLISDAPPYKCPACGWAMSVIGVDAAGSKGVEITYACLRDHPDDKPGVAMRTGKIVSMRIETQRG